MTDTTAETAPDTSTEQADTETDQGKPDDLGDAGKQAIDRMKAERNEATRKAATLQKELDTVRQSQMSETEKAIAEAEARGRAAAGSDYGKRLATSEIRAAAATAQADLKGVFDYLDISRFVGDDGEPDEKAIKAFVEGLPKSEQVTPSFDGGTRTATKPADFNQELRRAAGRA